MDREVLVATLSLILVITGAATLIDSQPDVDGAAQEFDFNGIQYRTISDSEVEVSGATVADVRPPNTIYVDGHQYVVGAVGEKAFASNTTIQSFMAPSGMSTIESEAFRDCPNLVSIDLNAVKELGYGAFSHCIRLTSVEMPASLTDLGIDAFSYCINLTEFKMKSDATVGVGAFRGCNNLKDVTLPDMVEIPDFLFSGCESLTGYSIPSGVTHIGNEAFKDCRVLEIDIPDGVVHIGSSAFEGCLGLTVANLGDNLDVLDSRAFYGTGITEVTIPDSLTGLGAYAFAYAENLRTVTIHDEFRDYGKGAFQGDKNLVSIGTTNLIASIPDECFEGCVSLRELPVTDRMTSIGDKAFRDCSSITSINLGPNMRMVGNYAFDGCSSVTSISISNPDLIMKSMTFNLGTPYKDVTCTAYVPVDGMLEDSHSTSTTFVYVVSSEPSDESYTIRYESNGGSGSVPNLVVDAGTTFTLSDGSSLSFDGHRLAGWSALPTSSSPTYDLGQTLRDYTGGSMTLYAVWVATSGPGTDPGIDPDPGDHTHRGGEATCCQLAVCEVCGEGYGSYNPNNHSGGTELVGYKAPTSSEPGYSGDVVCRGCDAVLERGSIINTTAPNVGTELRIGDYVYYVTSTSPATVGVESYSGGPLEVWIPSTVTDGSTTYSVTSLRDYAFRGNATIESVVVPDSITKLGSGVFYGCPNLKSVVLPAYTEIGSNTFKDCISLEDVDIASGTRLIGEWMFYGCTDLERITLPDSVTTIGNNAFTDCTSLRTFTMSDSVTSIGVSMFYGCTSLESVELPDTLKSIENSMFARCSSLTSVDLPSGIQSIGDYAFNNCSSLTEIDIPNMVRTIGDHAFANTGLRSLTIPEGVLTIDRFAFSMSAVSEVDLPDSLRTIGEFAFQSCSNLRGIDLNDGLETIENRAFSGSGLTSISIPSSVQELDGALAFCQSLEEVVVEPGNDSFVVRDGILYTSNLSTAVASEIDIDGRVVLPDCLEVVGEYCFANRHIDSVALPDGLTTIGPGAFWGSDFRTVAIPDSVSEIGEAAFVYCHYLADIEVSPQNRYYEYHDNALFTKGMDTLVQTTIGIGESYSIPEGVVVVESFSIDSDDLRALRIPSTVELIGSNAVTAPYLKRLIVDSRDVVYEGNALSLGTSTEHCVCYVQTIDGTQIPDDAYMPDYTTFHYESYGTTGAPGSGDSGTILMIVAVVVIIVVVAVVAVVMSRRGKTKEKRKNMFDNETPFENTSKEEVTGDTGLVEKAEPPEDVDSVSEEPKN